MGDVINNSRFKKGHNKKGRPPGSTNINTMLLKDALLIAATPAGHPLWSRKMKLAFFASNRCAKPQSGRLRRSKITAARGGGKESAPSSRAPPRAAGHAFPKLAANGPFRGDGLTDAIGPF
jgi:hypothetical protein